MTQDNANHEDKADALEALAAGAEPDTPEKDAPAASAPVDPAAALSNLEGAALAEPGEAEQVEHPQEVDCEDPAAALGNLTETTESVAQIGHDIGMVEDTLRGREATKAMKARAAMVQKQTRLAHAIQFRQILIPLLVVFAVILFLLGAIVLLTTQPQDVPQGVKVDWTSDPNVRKTMGILAFPIGAILLLGVRMFHNDIKRLKDSQR